MKKYFLSLITGCFLLSSCGDWLDILPKNEQVTADYWKEKEDVEDVLASGYYFMRECTEYLIPWSEVRASSVVTYVINDFQKMQDFQLTASSSVCKWGIFYEVINMANSVIKYAPSVLGRDGTYTEQAMRSHQSEAYFMRALMYFYLVRNFKEVPLVMDPYVDDSAPYAIGKSSEEVIIAQIKADILTALQSNAAKESFEGKWATKGRATKWALYALMADVCLWSEDYDNCIIYANHLIEATSNTRPAFMTISEHWFTIFNPGNSNESIFELNWDDTTYGQKSFSPSLYYTLTVSPQYGFSETILERFMEERVQVIISGQEDIRGRYGSYSGSNVWKYNGTEYEDVARTKQDANYIIYRMADIMLMKAEALIWKGKSFWQSAVDIINQVRVRAHLNQLTLMVEEEEEITMLEHVLHERDMELAAEGKRWYDLMRLGKNQNYKYKQNFIETVVINNTTANDSWIRSVLRNENAWYLPIHAGELEVNELLKQNPYYETTN